MFKTTAFDEFSKSKKLSIVAGVSFAMLVIFITNFYVPASETIKAKKEALELLRNEIKINGMKAQHLDRLKKENKQLQKDLQFAKMQLPPEDEISGLLQQITNLGIETGLEFKVWRPGLRSVNASKIYVEIPVAVEMEGSYHSVGIFLDKISKLPRIVNVSNIKMDQPVETGKEIRVKTSLIATAFALPKESDKEEIKEDVKGEVKKGSPQEHK